MMCVVPNARTLHGHDSEKDSDRNKSQLVSKYQHLHQSLLSATLLALLFMHQHLNLAISCPYISRDREGMFVERDQSSMINPAWTIITVCCFLT